MLREGGLADRSKWGAEEVGCCGDYVKSIERGKLGLGQYVIEILQLLEARVQHLDKSVYRNFLLTNPEFLALTAQRVISYWDCFYRTRKRNDYLGFRVLHFFKELATEKG